MSRPVFNSAPVDYIFKIYYDPETGKCKAKGLGDSGLQWPYITVDHKIYESIESCDNYKVVDGKIERIKFRTIHKKIELVELGRFATLKGNMLFAVPTHYNGSVDYYEYTNRD